MCEKVWKMSFISIWERRIQKRTAVMARENRREIALLVDTSVY